MPHSIFHTSVDLPNIKKLHIALADDDTELVFQVETIKKVGDKPPQTVTVKATAEQVDIIMRFAGLGAGQKP